MYTDTMSIESVKSKIAILLKEVENFREADRKQVILDFILNELHLAEKTQVWGPADLHKIRSLAVAITQNLRADDKLEGRPILSDGKLIDRYCMVSATLGYLRGKGLLPYAVEIKDLKAICHHENVEDESTGHRCADCGERLKPIWVPVSK
jgi:hypothetical protein